MTRSCDTGQRIPCFDSCQLTIIWMSVIKLSTGYMLPHYLESLTFHISFPVCGRIDGHVIIKISRMGRLTNFLRCPLARAPLLISLRFLKLDFLSFSFCGVGEELFTFLYLLLMMEVVCWLYQTMAFVQMSSGYFLEPSSFLLVFYCTYRAMHWLSLDLICYHGNETYGTCVYQLKDLGQHMRSPWNKQ